MQSLYVHIPFCDKKCFYCSFVVSIGQEKKIDKYLSCIEKEALKYKDEKVKSIYIGGGTPTLMSNAQLERIFQIIKQNFNLIEQAEITIEANPEGLDHSKLQLLKNLGVNRISLGIQSFNDQFLKYLGRIHNSEKAIKAYSLIKDSGFDNINVDLMFCFPDQSLSQLSDDIDKIISLDSQHISVYSLMIEENSRFFAQNVILNKDAFQAKQYEMVVKELKRGGYAQYEVSNFAKKGRESNHNINYWEGGDYIGLGVGSHSHQEGNRFWNVTNLFDYMEYVTDGDSPIMDSEMLDQQTRFIETLLIGLRMNRGVNIKLLEKRFGIQFEKEKEDIIHELLEENLLQWDGVNLQATSIGRLVLDEISTRLF